MTLVGDDAGERFDIFATENAPLEGEGTTMEQMLSCDTSVALGAATFDGSVIFAKNSDRAANECQPLFHVPRQQHASGATAHANTSLSRKLRRRGK